MPHHLKHTICSALLLFIYYSSKGDSFGGRGKTGAFRSYYNSGRTIISAKVTKFHQSKKLVFNRQQLQHELLFCHTDSLIPNYESRTIGKIDGSYTDTTGRVPTRLHMTTISNDDTSFDYSSKLGWEEYYKRELIINDISCYKNDGNNTFDATTATTEWHASIPLDTISSYCWVTRHERGKKSILMIGCGTSRLVDVVISGIPYKNSMSNGDDVHITLLDSSQTCINELTRRYQNIENVHCICGDAIQLENTLSFPNTSTTSKIPQRYDTIIDKGLMDVLFCSDDWTLSVKTLFSEAIKVLAPSGGSYVLISYKLSKMTREFLIQLADGVGYTWEFNCVGSTERVHISVSKPLPNR